MQKKQEMIERNKQKKLFSLQITNFTRVLRIDDLLD